MTGALDMHLSDVQRDLYEDTRALAARVLKPIADAGRPGRVNRSLIKSLAEHGLLDRLFGGDGNSHGSPAGGRGVAFASAGGDPSSSTRGAPFAGAGDTSSSSADASSPGRRGVAIAGTSDALSSGTHGVAFAGSSDALSSAAQGVAFAGTSDASSSGTRGAAFAGTGGASSSAAYGVAFAGAGGTAANAPTSAHISAIDLCLIREALARACTEAETAFGVQGLGAHPILQAGTPAVIEEWIPRVRDGSAVAAFALTEPQAGSDVRALELKAEPDGDGDGAGAGYRLTGEKLWISNAPEADIYTVFARAPEGITAFAVPGNCDGLSGEHRMLLSPHAIGSLRFDQVFVPMDHVLGRPGEGFKVAMRTLDLFRPSVGAFAIGMARTALALATARALERSTFGRPLRDNQSISHRIADIAARVEAARLLVHRAAAAHDAGIHDPGVAAMAKLVATETAQEAVDAAVQIHGALGLEVGHPLEHLYREVRAPRIYEGASEIQREIISRRLFRAAGEAK